MASDGSRRNPVKTYVVCITSTGYALYHAVGLDPYQTNKDSFLHAVRGDLSSFLSVMRLRAFHDFQSEDEFCEEKRALSDPDVKFYQGFALGHFLHDDYRSVELGVFTPHITEFLKEFADIPACVFNEFYLQVSECAGRNYDKYIDKYHPESRNQPVSYGLPLLARGSYDDIGKLWDKAGEILDLKCKLAKCRKLQYRKEIAKRERSQQKLVTQGLMVSAEESQEGKEKKMKKAEKKRKRKEEEEKTHDKEVHNVKSEKKEKRKLAKCSHGKTSKSEKKKKKLRKLEHS